MDVAGKVYQEDDLLPGAEVNLDFGTVKAVSGQDGSYLLESLEDGRHYVEILVDGKVVGRTQFVLQAAEVNETVVDTLSDGTQRVQYPKGTVKVYLTLSSMRMEVSPFARVKSRVTARYSPGCTAGDSGFGRLAPDPVSASDGVWGRHGGLCLPPQT